MIEGVKEMAAVMKALPDQLARNALAATARAGAQELQSSGYAYLSMAMNRSAREDDVVIRQARGEKGDRLQSVYNVGPPKRKPWLRWLHDGTAPHLISSVTKYGTRRGVRNVAYGVRGVGKFSKQTAKRVLASSATIFGTTVQHPGQPSRPWLEQAVFASQNRVMKAMAEKLRAALPKQVNRLVSSKFRRQQLRRFLR
jgi:hypothetical protein